MRLKTLLGAVVVGAWTWATWREIPFALRLPALIGHNRFHGVVAWACITGIVTAVGLPIIAMAFLRGRQWAQLAALPLALNLVSHWSYLEWLSDFRSLDLSMIGPILIGLVTLVAVLVVGVGHATQSDRQAEEGRITTR